MKLKIALLLIGLVLGSISHAQIKIGTNPQNINASSVLELESTSRALVLTRVNSTQMNAIRPLQGALVYNTETKCVHYYDGTQWLNICDALTNSVNISMVDNGDGSYTFTDAVGVETIITTTTNATFEVANDSLVLTDSNNNALSVALDSLNRHTYSTDAIVNLLPINDSTIVIRRNGNNFNFEVGEITGSNIQDRSIRNVDIGPTAINGDFHIQNRSVTPIKIQPGTLGQILQTQTISGVLTPAWVNKAGLFNATEISYDASASGLAAANVKEAIDELSTTSNSLTIGDILTQGNDAGAQLIRNVLDPSDAQDVATRNYVDTAIIAAAPDGSETLVTQGSDIIVTGTGISGDPYIINNAFTEAQGLEDVLTINNDAGSQIITNLGTPIAGTDATTKDYVDTAIIAAAPDGSETLVTQGSDIIVTGTGISGDPYIINNAFTEAQGLEDVLTINNDAGSQIITNLGTPIAGTDATTKDYVDTAIIAAAPDGSETLVTQGSDIIVTGTGISGDPYIINNAFTEAQGLDDVLTLNNDAGSQIITNLGTPIAGTDATTKDYVDTAIIAAAPDGSETLVTQGSDIIVTGTGISGDPYIINNAFTEAQGLDDVLTLNNDAGSQIITNLGTPIAGTDATTKDYVDTAIIAAAPDGSETLVTQGSDIIVTGTGISGDPYIINNAFTEAQGLDDVLTLNNDAGSQIITNLGTPIAGTDATTKDYVDTAIIAAAPDGSETLVTQGSDIIVTGTGISGDPYIINNAFTEAQGLDDVLTLNNDAGSQIITNLGTPIAGTDATTKDYVDAINTNLSTTNLTQTAALDRSYDINGQNLSFTNGQVAVGIATPTSTLHTGGSFATSITPISANTSLNETHYTLIIGADLEIDLPDPTSCRGRIYIIKNPDSSIILASPDYTVTITSGDSYLDSLGNGKTTFDIGVTKLQSDGSDWQQIN